MLFRRWLLAAVAQWLEMSRDHGNALVPMLIGGQGTHKSTFCRLLLPPELREYYIDDIKLDNAEQVERMLARMLLVNIDEYNAKTEREQAKIKRVLTERDVQTRRMRSDQYQLLPRMASFIATTNDRQPLTDPAGSRRYICCDIDGIIDTDTPIDHRQLYAQAVAELQRGARWHLTKDEEARLERHNQDYRIETSPEQVLLACYEPAPRHKDNFVRTVYMLSELQRHVGKTDLPSVKLLLADGSTYGHEGKVTKMSGVIDQATGSVQLIALFQNPERILKSGGSGTIVIPRQATNAIIIPQSCVSEVQNKKFIFLLGSDNKVKYTEIKVDPQDDGNNYIVTEGLKAGDKYVTNGVTKLTDGMEIKPITPERYQQKIAEQAKAMTAGDIVGAMQKK
jgi:hypothetical protein